MKLFERTKLGNVKLRNRIALAPMGMKSGPEGYWDDRNVEFYRRVAEGGAGLLTLGCFICTEEFEKRSTWVLEDYYHLGGLSLVCDKVHWEGAAVMAQMSIGLGRIAFYDPERPPLSASPNPMFGDPSLTSGEFTEEQIARLVERFGQSALLAKHAGVDAVEFQAYGGYLFDQFMTPRWNRRTDQYGGSLENRLRIVTECLQAVRKTCGPDMPVSVKITPTHLMPEEDGYRGIEEGIEMSKMLEAAGFDVIHVDNGCYERYNKQIPTVYDERGTQLETIRAVRNVVSVPIIGNGKLNYPSFAEKVLEDGDLDIVALGHQMLADPDWPKKVKSGRLHDINFCIGCNECLFYLHLNSSPDVKQGRHRLCAINPLCTHEWDYKVEDAKVIKKVLVAGGGPGGIMAAKTAAQRGHKVDLWEKSDQLGGNLRAAAAPEFKEDVQVYLDNAIEQLINSPVNIVLNKEATADEIIRAGYDNVVIATGSRPIMLNLKKDAESAVKVMCSNDALLQRRRMTGEVVVIGAGLVGCETALHIEKTAHKVILLECLDEMLKTSTHYINNDTALMELMNNSSIETICGATVTEITKDGLKYVRDGKEIEIKCDTVVMAAGYRSVDNLEDELWDKVDDIRVIGDAVGPRKVVDAVHEGFHYARII